MSHSHQDWETVILKKKKVDDARENVTKTSVNKTTISYATGKPAWKIEKEVDSETGKPLIYVSREDANNIIKGRIEMKLSQKDLANRLNMQFKYIQEIETCKAIENKQDLSRIKRFLKIETK